MVQSNEFEPVCVGIVMRQAFTIGLFTTVIITNNSIGGIDAVLCTKRKTKSEAIELQVKRAHVSVVEKGNNTLLI